SLVSATSARRAKERRRGGKRKKKAMTEAVTSPQVAEALDDRQVALIMGNGTGLDPGAVRAIDAVVRPRRPFED
ncbi:hypothetical protein, partial [Oceanidesulfovibrio marinus]